LASLKTSRKDWTPFDHVARVAVMVVTAVVLLVLGPLELLARAFRESQPHSSGDVEDKRHCECSKAATHDHQEQTVD
jgi:hypothetical protein